MLPKHTNNTDTVLILRASSDMVLCDQIVRTSLLLTDRYVLYVRDPVFCYTNVAQQLLVDMHV